MKVLQEEPNDIFKKELRRKAFHQLILLYLGAYFLMGRSRLLPILAGWTALLWIGERLRLNASWARHLAQGIFSGIMRDKEADRLSGAFYATLGVLATVFFYGSHAHVVAAALLYLTFGDAVSALVGMRFGRRPYIMLGAQRTVAGTSAGFLTAFCIGIATGFSPTASIGAAMAFSVVDSLPLPVDDNLSIPVVGATALYFLG